MSTVTAFVETLQKKLGNAKRIENEKYSAGKEKTYSHCQQKFGGVDFKFIINSVARYKKRHTNKWPSMLSQLPI